MPSRRYHSKSRLGCIPCKRSHIKCDQNRPICTKCSRSGKSCEYPNITESATSRQPSLAPSVKPVSRARSPFTIEPNLGPNEGLPDDSFTIFDMQLMHQYTSVTCLTVGAENQEIATQMEQIMVPNLALQHPFLLHSLLALAALHLLSLEHFKNPSACLEAALNHHNLSLSKSKTALNSPNSENQDALYLFTAKIFIFALALPINSRGAGMEDPIREAAQLMALIRGSVHFAELRKHQIELGGQLRPLIPKSFLESTADIPESIQRQLDLVQQAVLTVPSDAETTAVCLQAIEVLALCFRNTVDNLEHRTVVVSWLAMIPQEFSKLLSDKQPMALVILAQYGVLLHKLRDVWWCKSWGVELISFISRLLDSQWAGLVEWPRERVGLLTS